MILILQAQQLEGLESLSNVYAQFINLPLDDLALQRLYDLAKQSVLSEEDAGNYLVRGACSVCLYGLDQWAAENVRVLEGDLSSERWQKWGGIYVTANDHGRKRHTKSLPSGRYGHAKPG